MPKSIEPRLAAIEKLLRTTTEVRRGLTLEELVRGARGEDIGAPPPVVTEAPTRSRNSWRCASRPPAARRPPRRQSSPRRPP